MKREWKVIVGGLIDTLKKKLETRELEYVFHPFNDETVTATFISKNTDLNKCIIDIGVYCDNISIYSIITISVPSYLGTYKKDGKRYVQFYLGVCSYYPESYYLSTKEEEKEIITITKKAIKDTIKEFKNASLPVQV